MSDEKLLKELLTELEKNTGEADLKKLDELKLSWAGKLFFAGVAASLASATYKGIRQGLADNAPRLPIKIRGTKEQIQAVMAAITSSRAFQAEINKPGATIDQVINKLKLKNLNKQQFKKITGKDWPM